MPSKKVSAVAPVATRPSRARSARNAAIEAVSASTKKVATKAKAALKKLSPKPTKPKKPTAATTTTTSSKKSNATSTTAETATSTSRPVKRAAGAIAASKKTQALEADAGKRANISKKRSIKEEEDDDKEIAPKNKRAKATTAPKANAAPSKATTGRKPAPKAVRAKATTAKAAPALNRPVKRKNDSDDESEDGHARKWAKTDDEDEGEKMEDAPAPVSKKGKVAKKSAAPKQIIDPILKVKIGVQINTAPTEPLDIFVFGEGSAGELGLGAKKINRQSPIDVKRPRKNILLSAPTVGVVQLACGGMHAIALTNDNKILTWGVNDVGALGRDTAWDGVMRDMNAAEPEGSDSEDDDDDSGLNPRESTPTEIDLSGVAPNTKFVAVAACDSASFAVTEDGRVYAWGTFRGADGPFGFSPAVDVQHKPLLLNDVTKVVAIATGSNHVLVLDYKGKIYTWGAHEQNQLGRRVVERSAKESGLRAGGIGFKRGVRIVKIAAGSYHSFALDDQGRVWSWGLNNFGQLGHSASADDDDLCKLEPTLIESLSEHRVIDVIGGEHHTMVVTDQGKALTFGRITSGALGFPKEVFNEDNTLYNEENRPSILFAPTELPGLPKIVAGGIGTDTSYVVTEEGRAYSWGMNVNYQCGIGETAGDVITPQLMSNKAVNERKIMFAGGGGQYGMLAAVQVMEE